MTNLHKGYFYWHHCHFVHKWTKKWSTQRLYTEYSNTTVRLILPLRSTFLGYFCVFCVLYPYNIKSILYLLLLCILCDIHLIRCIERQQRNLIIRIYRAKIWKCWEEKLSESALNTKVPMPAKISRPVCLLTFVNSTFPANISKFRLSLRHFDWVYFLRFHFMRVVLLIWMCLGAYVFKSVCGQKVNSFSFVIRRTIEREAIWNKIRIEISSKRIKW